MNGSTRIVGVAQTVFGKHRDRTIESLAVEAGVGAVRDAGLDRTGIEALFCGNVFGGSLLGQRIGKEMGLDGLPTFNHENACASGAAALHDAIGAVTSGQYETVLVIGVEQLSALGGGLLPSGGDPEMNIGLTQPAAYAMRTESYLSRFGGRPEDIAQVVVKSRQRASQNRFAQYRTPTSLDEVMASRLLADPITLRSVEQAYSSAGVTARNVDVAEVHDAAAIGEVMYYEALGLCERGEGMDFVLSGESAKAGATAVNTGGGLLSRGHPLGATGLAQVAELTAQLRGETGANQVDGAEVAVAH
ncbi:MAG: thiolase family protein, partial [Actinomycetales bacterium]